LGQWLKLYVGPSPAIVLGNIVQPFIHIERVKQNNSRPVLRQVLDRVKSTLSVEASLLNRYSTAPKANHIAVPHRWVESMEFKNTVKIRQSIIGFLK